MANAQLTNYLIPTTLDTPRMDVVMLEHPYAGGPFGAKGLGELPIDGPAPGDRERDPPPRHRRRGASPPLPEQIMEAACASR